MASIINATTTAGVSVQGDNSGSLQLATNNGTTAVTIDTSQNVGIGTSSPSYKLQVSATQATAGITSTTASQTPFLILNNTADSSNSYIFCPNKQLGIVQADTSANSIVYFSTQNTERMRIDSSGNVGIGTTSPTGKLEVIGGQLRVAASSASSMFLVNPSTTYADGVDIQATYNGGGSFGPLKFTTSSTERMRIDSSGLVLVNKTSANGTSRLQVNGISGSAAAIETFHTSTDTQNHLQFNNGSVVGTISTNGSSTAYNTSSDYRLKENIVPMIGALATVQALKPVTYKWKIDGSDGQGFIAHELQEVVPDCVTGEKDAVDEEGNPQYQGIDTSFLVATLTAAIQELKAELDSVKAEVQALKGIE